MIAFTFSMHIQIMDARYADKLMIFSSFQLCLALTFGLTMNILTYYGLQEGKEGARIATLVFHILVWIIIAPSTFYNLSSFYHIARSEATFYQKTLCTVFFFYVTASSLLRVVLYLGIYPCTILINKDYEGFSTKFQYAETYVIPATDLMTFVLGILQIMIGYNSSDKMGDFFSITSPQRLNNHNMYNDYYGNYPLIEGRPQQVSNKIIIEAKIVLVGNSKVGKSWLTFSHVNSYPPNEYTETIIPTYNTRMHNFIDGQTLKAHIWTTSGSKAYSKMTQTYFTNVDSLVLCFSLDDSQSLQDINYWDELFEKSKTPENFKTKKYLIAMKADLLSSALIDENRAKAKEMAKQREF